MTFTMVEDEIRVVLSSQTTSVPFMLVFTGLVNSLVISGKVFGGETLEIANKTELTVRSAGV